MQNQFMAAKKLTTTEYAGFQHAYDYYNQRLFANTLPEVLVTLQRAANTYGYFHARKFEDRTPGSGVAVHELALNPDGFGTRTDKEILSTLVHEMVHVWQQEHGKPPRKCYHDREWSNKMKAVGLQPSHTGAPGGKETGAKMTHYIMTDGMFNRVTDQLLASGFRLNWESRPDASGAAKKRASKTKFSCPECAQNVWAKPDAQVICGECYEEDESIITMLAEPADDEELAA